MSENSAEVEVVDPDDDTTNPYLDLPVEDGVGIQDDEADELDPEVGA